eukprot:9237288-Ditylum_brightwellii.AAC.1
MKATSCHSYKELQYQYPGYVLPCVPPNKDGKLGPKVKIIGKLSLHLVKSSWKARPTHCVK